MAQYGKHQLEGPQNQRIQGKSDGLDTSWEKKVLLRSNWRADGRKESKRKAMYHDARQYQSQWDIRKDQVSSHV